MPSKTDSPDLLALARALRSARTHGRPLTDEGLAKAAIDALHIDGWMLTPADLGSGASLSKDFLSAA